MTVLGAAVIALVVAVGSGALGGLLRYSPDNDRAARAVAALDSEQLCNAATVIETGSALGLSTRDQTIAVMTAMGESSLRNIQYGDWETNGQRNPDGSPTTSIGLFQQQDNWGTNDERLDPKTAATLFYRAMTEKVPEPERTALEPTIIAHRTQVNDDPMHYERYWLAAVAVVEKLTAADAATAPLACP